MLIPLSTWLANEERLLSSIKAAVNEH